MGRTQVYLSRRDLSLLARVARATGASRSELIRRAIQARYGARPVTQRLAALERSGGTWKSRPFSGAQYVDAIRGDLSGRLKQLGLV